MISIILTVSVWSVSKELSKCFPTFYPNSSFWSAWWPSNSTRFCSESTKIERSILKTFLKPASVSLINSICRPVRSSRHSYQLRGKGYQSTLFKTIKNKGRSKRVKFKEGKVKATWTLVLMCLRARRAERTKNTFLKKLKKVNSNFC